MFSCTFLMPLCFSACQAGSWKKWQWPDKETKIRQSLKASAVKSMFETTRTLEFVLRLPISHSVVSLHHATEKHRVLVWNHVIYITIMQKRTQSNHNLLKYNFRLYLFDCSCDLENKPWLLKLYKGWNILLDLNNQDFHCSVHDRSEGLRNERTALQRTKTE